jgi:hypothetical protein
MLIQNLGQKAEGKEMDRDSFTSLSVLMRVTEEMKQRKLNSVR